MSVYTRRYNKFKSYTLEDCACIYCLHYPGRKNRPCPLEVCCCAEERRLAIERDIAEMQQTTVNPCRV